ncbi:MAG: immunity protein Imm33 domain-containing protein [Burkholderiaceae bacterium]
MRHVLDLALHRLVVDCGEDLAKPAQGLLRMLARGDGADAPLHDGLLVEFGWAPLRLVQRDGALEVWEPDFARDPAAGFHPGADTVLRVLAKQAAVVHACGARAQATRWNELVHADRAALAAPRLALVRMAAATAGDSGWRLGAPRGGSDLPAGTQPDPLPAWRLLHERHGAMKVLALPVGYSVVLDGDAIAQVRDGAGRGVWPEALVEPSRGRGRTGGGAR